MKGLVKLVMVVLLVAVSCFAVSCMERQANAQLGILGGGSNFEFSVGQSVVVVDPYSAYFGRVGIVVAVNYAGCTNSEPPTFFGEIDTVAFSRTLRANFDHTQLDRFVAP